MERQPPCISAETNIFCAAWVYRRYPYEASLEITGFVLLRKVPEKKTDRRVFDCFWLIVKFGVMDLRTPSLGGALLQLMLVP